MGAQLLHLKELPGDTGQHRHLVSEKQGMEGTCPESLVSKLGTLGNKRKNQSNTGSQQVLSRQLRKNFRVHLGQTGREIVEGHHVEGGAVWPRMSLTCLITVCIMDQEDVGGGAN